MSEHAPENGQAEQRSRIKLVLNAKHDTQWELSVVAGESEEELDRIRGLAVKQHNALVQELLHGKTA